MRLEVFDEDFENRLLADGDEGLGNSKGEGAQACSEAAIGETLNLATGKEISIGDLARKIAGLIDKEVEFETEERRIRPGTSEVMRLCGSGEKAAAIIGWTPEFTLDE
ncbi:MAG: hypothetical protein QGI11_10300, partial [Nitrospinota bacterium]|nr:hypothetical protein [Nitrospinota bacterium]